MTNISSPFTKDELIPQEEIIEVTKINKDFIIGIPKEIDNNENRICLAPDSIHSLVGNGFKINIESGAGIKSNYTDLEYSEAGAKIVKNKKELFKCPIILKISPPTLQELKMIKSRSILISTLQLNKHEVNYFQEIKNRKLTSIALEYIKEEDDSYPVTNQLNEITGQASVLISTELISKTIYNNGKGLLLGSLSGVKPVEIVIIGSNTIASSAIKTAIGLGASVKVFSNSIFKLSQIQSQYSYPIFTSTIQPKQLTKALMRSDIVIGTINSINSPIVSKEMILKMKEGSVIIDLSIENGKCFETSKLTTHDKPTFKKFGVTHYCVPNIPSRYSRTASICLSNVIAPLILKSKKYGSFENFIRNNNSLKNGIYAFNGNISNKIISQLYGFNYTNINNLI